MQALTAQKPGATEIARRVCASSRIARIAAIIGASSALP
jgi:hypothetical protein